MSISSEEKAKQFLGKDAKGLLPEDKAKTEAEARKFYLKFTVLFNAIIGPGLATALYLGASLLFPTYAATVQAKLAFVRQYDLGYVFAAWCAANLGRTFVQINANAARDPARVDRPDQQVYQIMAETGPLADAPYVLMVNVGPLGRFNRAQRACANLDEALPLFATGLCLQALVFGPIALGVALLYAYGATKFSALYKEDPNKRLGGFLFVVFAYQISAGLVLVAAVLALLVAA